ncbi:TPA: hypothetical protein HA238_02710, partial [Candidatus Micrarchaeota archaeon]|nr:hypothetical protein [Candidatus Micrarchaeota archaeon]
AHNFAVTTVSSLISDAAARKAGGETTMFSPQRLLQGKPPSASNTEPSQDSYNALTLENEYWGSGYEGIIKVEIYESKDEKSHTWHKVKPVSVEFKDSSGKTNYQPLNTINGDDVLMPA